jgi:hypothetical protein
MIERDNTNRHFKGQLRTEEIQCFCRKHWIILIQDLIGFLLFICFIVFLAIYFKGIYKFFAQDSFFSSLLAFSIVTFITLYIHRFFLRFIRYFLDIIIITNYRLVILEKSLYLQDSKDAIDLAKIQDIRKEQHGIIRNVLRFGKLVITLSATSTTKVLPLVPNPDYHFRKINTLKRDYIRDRLGKREQSNLNDKQDVFPEWHPAQTISGLSQK